MKVIYSDQGKSWPEGTEPLQQATHMLEEAIGPPADRVTAEWHRTSDDRGRTLYDLRISDAPDTASAQFAPDELRSSTDMRYRLLRLWGDLLQARHHRYLRGLGETGGTET